MADAKGKAKRKKRDRKVEAVGVAHVMSTFNNTIITIADTKGEVVSWASSGKVGFKGSRKSTPFAAQRAADKVADKLRKMGVHELEVRVKGPGSGRESAIRALAHSGIDIKLIEDCTPLPHNGCRPPKRRRV